MMIKREFLETFYENFSCKQLHMGIVPYTIELYFLDTLIKLLLALVFGILNIELKNFLIAVSAVSIVPFVTFPGKGPKFLTFILTLSSYMMVFLSYGFEKSFLQTSWYKDSIMAETEKIVESLKTSRMTATSQMSSGFTLNITDNAFQALDVTEGSQNWTLNSLNINSVQYPYDKQDMVLFYPRYYENKNQDFSRYSWTQTFSNVTINLNRFDYKCVLELFTSEGVCSTDKQRFKIARHAFNSPFELFTNLDTAKMTKFDFGYLAIINLKHLTFNYTEKIKQNTTQKILLEQLLNKTDDVYMPFFKNVKAKEEKQINLMTVGNVTYKEVRQTIVPRWYRAIDPNYIEWLLIVGFVIVQGMSAGFNQELIKKSISMSKYCFVLYFINSNFKTLGQFVLYLLPEVMVLSSGKRQIGRSFSMRFRSSLIKKEFLSGNCVTFTILSCIVNDVKTVTVKRNGDLYHLRPGGKILLKRFLSFYFSGFDIRNSKISLSERVQYIFKGKDYHRTNFYTSLIWSLFERQGYVKDFLLFEKIIACYHPNYSCFKRALKEKGIKTSADVCKRIIYFVFYNTKIQVPNWGDYTPAKVDVTFVKPLKPAQERKSTIHIQEGCRRIDRIYAPATPSRSLRIREDVNKNKIKTIVTEIKTTPELKLYTNSDFTKKKINCSTRLTYRKLKSQKVSKPQKIFKFKICQSCYDSMNVGLECKNSLTKMEPMLTEGHGKYCNAIFNKLFPAQTSVLREKIKKEVEYKFSILDKVFFTKDLSPKRMHRYFKAQAKKIDKMTDRRSSLKCHYKQEIVKESIESMYCEKTLYTHKIKASVLRQHLLDPKVVSIHIAEDRDLMLKSQMNDKQAARGKKRITQHPDEFEDLIDFDIRPEEIFM